MTATQVFLRFLKENGYYTKYCPSLKKQYTKVKDFIISRKGNEFWHNNFYKPLIDAHSNGKKKCDERNIMLDVLLMHTQYRFIDSFYVIGVYNYEMSKYLYKFSIKALKRYQLTKMYPYFRYGRHKILQFEYK
jgi:hypothetical protein